MARGRTGAILAIALVSAACPSRPRAPDPARDLARYEALRSSLERAGAADAPEPMAAPEVSPTPVPGRAPRDDAERVARARAAWTSERPLPTLVPAGRGSRYAFAIEAASESGPVRDRLLLFDLGPERGFVVGEHEFDADDLGTPGSSEATPSIGQTFEAMSDVGEPLLLAEIEGRGRTLACGWWFERSRSRFVCAPSIGGPSRYHLVERDLFELWDAELPGDGGVPRVSGTSGRSLHLVGGRWREDDPFRCLGWPLEDALREAGAQGIANWQSRGVQQRVAAAARAADALETGPARTLLRDAVAIDGCDPVTWRLLGRLEYESGNAAAAVPALALALALRPSEPAAMLDLGDALAVLDSGSSAGSTALRRATETLRSRPATASLVARGGRRGARGLAAAAYRAFLETTARDPRLEVARRHARESLDALDGRAARPAPQPSPAAVPARPVAATPAPVPSPAADPAPPPPIPAAASSAVGPSPYAPAAVSPPAP